MMTKKSMIKAIILCNFICGSMSFKRRADYASSFVLRRPTFSDERKNRYAREFFFDGFLFFIFLRCDWFMNDMPLRRKCYTEYLCKMSLRSRYASLFLRECNVSIFENECWEFLKTYIYSYFEFIEFHLLRTIFAKRKSWVNILQI